MTSKKKKIITGSIIGSFIGLGAIGCSSYFIASSVVKGKQTLEYKNFVNYINNNDFNIIQEFTKGADTSSYADVIENFLFQKDIKKSDGTWYTYKDIENPDIKVTDEKTKKLVSLEEYINNNLYSYFDENSNRVYENMFSILKKKGINSIRLRLWVNPYDEKGNSYGGGHNDLDTTIFIIKQAKKYGFDDFLLDFQYSDFWADPSKNFLPKSWVNLSDNQLLEKAYSYTFDTLNTIFEETGLVINKVQFGNEIGESMLWKYDDKTEKIVPATYNFVQKFIRNAIKATNDFNINHKNIKIEKNIHLEVGDIVKFINNYREVIEQVDSIQISIYLHHGSSLDKLYNQLKYFSNLYPNKKLYIGEFAMSFDDKTLTNINQAYPYPQWVKDTNSSVDFQFLSTYQYIKILSSMFPNLETGFYWWEIGQLYIGKSSWSTLEGLKYYQASKEKQTWKDFNNWSSFACFDYNGIALPTLDVIKNFERNQSADSIKLSPLKNFDLGDIIKNQSNDSKYFFENIQVLWPKNETKYNLNDILYSNDDVPVNETNIDVNL
ncbi:MAG: arabinogalactan endo-1,4-beta-galactosidase, partial [Ureaplasma sp.]|nr:arabinogalactan endo-1,4-beta-galactosidase [Ureaplasma sp.]